VVSITNMRIHADLSCLFAELPKVASADHFETLLSWNITPA
jgi:hypothetical protein